MVEWLWLKSKLTVGFFTGCLGFLLGGWDSLISALFIMMVLDIITGIIKALKKHRLSSAIAKAGFKEKIVMFIIVCTVTVIDGIIGDSSMLRTFTIYFYIGIEGLSIIENAAIIGVPIPEKLKKVLLQLKEEEIQAVQEDTDITEK